MRACRRGVRKKPDRSSALEDLLEAQGLKISKPLAPPASIVFSQACRDPCVRPAFQSTWPSPSTPGLLQGLEGRWGAPEVLILL